MTNYGPSRLTGLIFSSKPEENNFCHHSISHLQKLNFYYDGFGGISNDGLSKLINLISVSFK